MIDSVSLLAAEKSKNSAHREALLEALSSKYAVVSDSVNRFMQTDWHEEADYIALAQNVVGAVDEVLIQYQDDSSLFLRNTLKPLVQIRKQAQAVLDTLGGAALNNDISAQVQLSAEQVPVYVLLFQAQGHDMQKWVQLLQSLGQYALGRPIYETEEDVQRVIRLRFSDAKEAYAKVAVPKSLLAAGQALSGRKDRHGNALLTLPMGAIKSQYILEFVHGKQHYRYHKGDLIHVSSPAKCH